MSIRLANFDHKASLSLREPHKLGENWLTTSQGTGWPQSYWYLNNLCIFIATTEHCGQKSEQTNNCFDFHVISDSDRVMIVIVMSLSVSDHFPDVPISSQTLGHKPDTNTQSVTPLWWVSQAAMLVRVSLYRWRHYLGEKERKALCSCLCFIQWTVSWSDDKSYGPNTSNTFQSLSPAIHFIGIWLSTMP